MSSGHADDALTRQKLLERTSDAVIVLDADLKCTQINQQAETLLDRDHDDLVDSHIWTAFPEMAGTDARTQIEDARGTNQQGTYEWHDTEGNRWFEVRVFPDDDALSLFFRDITTQKEREREIERYERLIGHLPVAVEQNTLGDDGEFTYVTEPMVDLLGADSQEDLTNHSSAEIYADADERASLNDRLQTRGKVEEEAVELERFDGEQFWGSVTASQEQIHGEQFVISLLEDVSEQRTRDRRLQWADGWFRNAHEGLFVVDVAEDEFVFERVNPAFEEISGLSDDTVEGNSPERVFGADDGDRLRSHYRDCVSRGEPVEFEVELSVPEADSRWKTRLAPVREDGDIVQLIGATRDITDRQDGDGESEDQSEETQQDRAWYETFADHTGEFVTILDTDETVTFVSPSAEQVSGHDPKALVGTKLLDRVHPDDRSDLRSQFDALRAGTVETKTETYRFEQADGSWAWVESTIVNRLTDPELEGIVLVTRDVSEQKDNKETLRQVRQRLDLAIEGLDISTWDWDKHADDVVFNDEWANIVKFAHDEPEFDFDIWQELIHPDDVADARAALEAHLDGETERYDHEVRMQTQDGNWQWVRTIGTVIDRDSDGAATRATGIHINITERNQAQQKLTETTKALEAIINTSPNAIVIVDSKGEIVLWNRAAEALFGWNKDEVLGKQVPFVPDDGADFEAVLGQQGNEAIRTVETVRETKAGEHVDVKLTSTRIQGDDGLVGYLGTYKDIGEEIARDRKLEAQSDTLDLLTRIVGHDIRNDLQMILGYTERLANHVDDDGRGYVREVLSNAKTAGELAQTTQTLADSMRQVGDSGKAVSLRSTLGQELDELRSSYTDALITTEGQIPAVDVLADETLAAVFRNVLTNAVEHNDKEIPEVGVTVETNDEDVLVNIVDNGPGIPDNHKDRIFNRGQKGSQSDGTGIGLYLAKVLAEQYGGDVWVEDKVASASSHGENTTVSDSEGSIFKIRLPRA